uniref:Uncharacterized protein n=1 Tax=Astyanax mexicanus TaxID=7994 RepID=A0A3B1KBM0_ASTMX
MAAFTTLLLLCGSEITFGGNVLVLPGEYSHWINMRSIVDELLARNNSVTVLAHSASPTINYSQKENFKYIVFKINMDQQDAINLWMNFIDSWMNSNFDAVLYDPMMMCSDLLAETLGVPHVVSLRLSFTYTLERLCGQMPAPPSYVPAAAIQGHLTDKMNFMERLENMILYIVHTTIFRLQVILTYDKHYTKMSGRISLILLEVYV